MFMQIILLRRMLVKKFLIVFLTLVLAAIGGLAMYVNSIDWNKHKSVIAEQFSAATGKKIVFDGPVSFELLPKPYLRATNVKIFNRDNDKEPLVDIPNMVGSLALAPLIKGEFVVQRMELKKPKINMFLLPDGKLNWQSNFTSEQKAQINNANFTLNSVGLQNAQIFLDDQVHNVAFSLDNLNGEFVAQSVLGPYRIEGNYIKDNEPVGFAVSLGQITDGFATTLNLAVTHPKTESYARFDGNVMLSNKTFNGEMVVESKKLRQFAEAAIKTIKFDPNYDYPLAVFANVTLNERQITFENAVVKYGDTQAAGIVEMPFNDGFYNEGVKPRILSSFNFTNFDLTPVVYALSSFVEKQAKGKDLYNPNFDFDMMVELEAARASYNGQVIKNFKADFDMVENILTISDLSARVPGDTDVSLKGTISSYDDELFYNVESAVSSENLLSTLKWLNLEPKVTTVSTYKRVNANAKISGTLDRVQVSPFDLELDKNKISGELGIRLDDRNDIMANVVVDSINFDNYLGGLPVEELEKNWSDKILYRFSKLSFLNDFDMKLNAKFNLGIYESTPFENVEIEADLMGGRLELKKFRIGTVLNSSLLLSGKVWGFGNGVKFENLNYDFETADVGALVSKLNMDVPYFERFKKLSAKGVASGEWMRFSTNTKVELANTIFDFNGDVDRNKGMVWVDGDFELKNPDFVKMLDNYGAKYKPSAVSMGLVNAKGKIKGNKKEMSFAPIDFNIGFNAFTGDVSYKVDNNERWFWKTNLSVNKLELDRFMPKGKNGSSDGIIDKNEAGKDFVTRPMWNKNTINYEFYDSFDLDGRFEVQELSYKGTDFGKSEAKIDMKQGVAEVTDLMVDYKGGRLTSSLKLQMRKEPTLSGKMLLEKANINQFGIGNDRYAIKDGSINWDFVFDGKASSESMFADSVSAEGSIVLKDFNVKGWDLSAVYGDIVNRENNEGLLADVQKDMQKGETKFSSFMSKVDVRKGLVVLRDVQMRGENVNIKVDGKGSIPAWNADILFAIKFDQPKHLPGFDFEVKGPLDAPEFEIDANKVFEYYQMRQDKKEAALQAIEDMKKANLQKKANEYKGVTDNLITVIKTTVVPEIEKYKLSAQNVEIQAKYDALMAQVNSVLSDLQANASMASDAEISDEKLILVQENNIKNEAKIEPIKNELQKYYLEDLKYANKLLYEQLVERYNEAKMLEFNYREIKQAHDTRLNAIGADWGADGNVVAWVSFLEDKFAEFDGEDKNLMDAFMERQREGNIELVLRYGKDLKDRKNVLDVDLENVKQTIDEYKIYADEKILAMETDFAKRQREAEVERKVQENTGSISIKKSGKVVKVSRDIAEIEKAEELADEKEIKVLDFSKPKQENSDVAPVKKNVVKKGRVKRY